MAEIMKMGREITLTEDELKKLMALLKDLQR